MTLSKIIPSIWLIAFAAVPTSAAHAQAGKPKAVLDVNDTNGVGVVGDARLSLDEAIRLANGTLTPGRLSPAERAQVKGTPGARSRDLIVLPQGATVTVAKGAAVSAVAGNDGDTIDGNGAMLASEDKGKGTGLKLASSNFVLRHFKARGFSSGVDVDFGGRNLTNISLENLHLRSLLEIGAKTSNGSLRGVSVSDSLLEAEGPTDNQTRVFIRAAATPVNGRVDNVLLENVRFVRNRIDGGKLGIYLTGSLGAGTTTNALTRNVVMSDNVFTNQHDAAVNLLGSLPAMGANHSKVGLENVVASGNQLETPNWGFYMGNENFGWQGKPSVMTDTFFRNITVEKNVITRNAKGVVGHCISIENSADFRGDQTSNNVMENIKIIDNDITGCLEKIRPGRPAPGFGTGIIVNAGRASLDPTGGGGVARNNIARNIQILNNRIKGSTRGIVVNGGYTRYLGSPPQEYSTVLSNTLTGLRIEGNRLEDNPTGIRITGGDGPAQTTITGNRVTGVTIRGNQISGAMIACEAIANAGAATSNTLDAACPTGG